MKYAIAFFIISMCMINTNSNAQNGLHFDGVDDWVDCGNDPSVDMSGATTLTLEAWIYPTAFKTNPFVRFYISSRRSWFKWLHSTLRWNWCN